MRGVAARVVAALLLILSAAPVRAADFDFYVLSLSWSPSFCADAGPDDAQQCGAARPHGFVVHGLWPQYERGYPSNCGGGGRLSRGLVDSVLDLMPDTGLVRYQWRKHGTCAGLRPERYFKTVRQAFEAVTIPEDFAVPGADRKISAYGVENAFIAANPGMTRDGIAISCKGGVVEEVRICLTRDLAFRSCDEVDRDGCRQKGLLLPGAD